MAEKKNRKADSDNHNLSQEIPGMNLDMKYRENKIMPEGAAEMQKEVDKTKKELMKLKAAIVKKFPFTQALGILPQQAVKPFIEDELGENIPEAEFKKLEKKMHVYMIIPEEKFKEIPKIKKEIADMVDKSGQNIWVYIKTPVDVWEACMDSKFDLVNFIGLSIPLYDTGFLAGLRVAEIHKNLVLGKFDKYVVSYVIGGSLVRGNATKTSDVDAFVIINDTDVKKMPRLELKERLRGMIYKYISEATAMAGIKDNILNVQIYLLTDFWEAVKDAHPVMFTFIRDGVPLYDRGTFLPWKALLRMGKLKPSPESIDLFMRTAEQTEKLVERRLLDAMVDLYYKVLNPSQALIMLYGAAPPTHKETPALMEKIFVEKEKMLKKTDVAVLARLVKLFRDYEHDPKMKVKGTEIDKLVKDSDAYIKRLETLRKQIEKHSNEELIEQIYGDVMNLLKEISGKKAQKDLIPAFEGFVKTGKFTPQSLRILKDIIKAKDEIKKGKLNSQKVDDVRKNASILINALTEFAQRTQLASLEKSRMILMHKQSGKNVAAELLNTNDASFLFLPDSTIKKITDRVSDSTIEEVQKHVEQQKAQKSLNVNPRVFELARKVIGDFDIVL